MIEWLKIFDTYLFFKINGNNAVWLDQVMMFVSGVWIWTPLYALLAYVIIKKFKKQAYKPILAIIIMIVMSDQGANLLKNNVKRFRPSHNLEIGPRVHTVDGYVGGQYGFVSSHAANVFALATFFCLVFSSSPRFLKMSVFLWATLISYSRIYLGVHYPFDIIGGALIGISAAFIMHWFLLKVVRN